ncbi:hypothetical protein J6TS7_55210 [Paenibacillus dendritiformis]|uniref:hypothetical protein n=1 Tax=Paenibacillus TaxID=44249 RepID=UPI001AFDAE72|nr:hypothetical protein [Paenibacillus dendritiformis]MEB9892684.1 hypothetical protein [Bacillus cereus]GIO81911.1 hypothetical protein J6TS7_55210 [Paenibacillus dendritiformis]
MANRYCNLVGSKKISEDFNNINVGFDKVQDEMDSKSSGDHRHPNATDQADGFMSAADKAKMDASTASATPGTLAQRDASGRLKAAAPSAKTDVARKSEVDTVQDDLDNHKADAVMHVTVEDHEKLSSIEEGAEVNQNAFVKVNDIEASEKTDSLVFKGGVGIKITTNPATNEVTFTSIGESTPGDHGSSHTEHGADPIPNATQTEGGLMSAADKAEFDEMAVEVPKQAAELEQHDKQLQEHTADLDDHGRRIDGVESDLANVPGTPLELQPGLQVVEAENDTPFRMGEVKGRTEIHDDVGIVNVTNPHAIATGGNLLPPFTEWVTQPGDVIVGPYHLQKTATAQYQGTISPKIRVIRGQTYALSSTRIGRMVLGEYKEDGTVIGYPIAEATDGAGYFSQSVTIGADTDYVIVQLSNMAASGTFTFEETTLTPGTEPKPFAPQQRSMLAFEAELAAHPVDGSNPDTLFMGDDGLPYVLESWRKVTLDSTYKYTSTKKESNFTEVMIENAVTAIPNMSPAYLIKFNGTLLTRLEDTKTAADQFGIHAQFNLLYVTVANTDSGWGPDYTPTQDEIKAYFFGWKLTLLGASVGNTPQYNGTGEKAWIPIVGFDGMNGTNITPTFESSSARSAGWQPYRLQYLKAKSTVEPVRNYELGATLTAGSNMVEVGSGIVIREKANPVYYSPNGNYYINNTGVSGSLLKNKVSFISRVYRNDQVDSFAKIENDANAYGKQHIRFLSSDLDPTAVYHVTYTMLDPTLAAPISGTVAANLRGTVSDLVQDVGDVQRRLSVVEMQKAERDNAVVWIKSSLINGWEYFGIGATAGYTKIGNVVYLKGKLRNGTPGTAVFRLPSGYRPKEALLFLCRAYDAGNRSVTVGVDPNGDVSVYDTNMEIHLDGTVFIAEQ